MCLMPRSLATRGKMNIDVRNRCGKSGDVTFTKHRERGRERDTLKQRIRWQTTTCCGLTMNANYLPHFNKPPFGLKDNNNNNNVWIIILPPDLGHLYGTTLHIPSSPTLRSSTWYSVSAGTHRKILAVILDSNKVIQHQTVLMIFSPFLMGKNKNEITSRGPRCKKRRWNVT